MSNASFLPEDYLIERAERRTNLISLSLFGIVMAAVVGAFFVTNRQALLVRQQQDEINQQYQQAAVQIEKLTQLETQRAEMLNKAELAAALVERVPRSILMAELINRMPERLALLEFDMKSERSKTAPLTPATGNAPKDSQGRLVAAPKAERGKTMQEAGASTGKVEAPRYDVSITMVGVAPTDLELSKFMTELNAFKLLRSVSLEYSEQKEIQGRTMRQFKIALALNSEADVRQIEPRLVPRMRNPLAFGEER